MAVEKSGTSFIEQTNQSRDLSRGFNRATLVGRIKTQAYREGTYARLVVTTNSDDSANVVEHEIIGHGPELISALLASPQDSMVFVAGPIRYDRRILIMSFLNLADDSKEENEVRLRGTVKSAHKGNGVISFALTTREATAKGVFTADHDVVAQEDITVELSDISAGDDIFIKGSISPKKGIIQAHLIQSYSNNVGDGFKEAACL